MISSDDPYLMFTVVNRIIYMLCFTFNLSWYNLVFSFVMLLYYNHVIINKQRNIPNCIII